MVKAIHNSALKCAGVAIQKICGDDWSSQIGNWFGFIVNSVMAGKLGKGI
jgi:hypothetical protein